LTNAGSRAFLGIQPDAGCDHACRQFQLAVAICLGERSGGEFGNFNVVVFHQLCQAILPVAPKIEAQVVVVELLRGHCAGSQALELAVGRQSLGIQERARSK
jgi:hypothetical protein